MRPALVFGFLSQCVVRVAGLPMNHLDALVSRELAKRASGLVVARADLERDAESLSAAIHELIPHQSRSGRRHLLRLRRDLYNLRSPAARDLEALEDAELHARATDLLERASAWDRSIEAFRAAYDAELAGIRTRLGSVLADADFCAGLRLSSRTLAERLEAFLSTSEDSLTPKAERALLRYLTRAAAKATPFGRFCAILPGRLCNSDGPMSLHGDPSRKWSRIRTNKRLVRPVLGRLAADETSRFQLPLRLNPTLEVGSDGVTFLAAYSGREAFQVVGRSSAVDLVVSTLRAGSGGTLRDLASKIRALDEVDATQEEAEAYLERLFDLGMLQLDLPGLGHDPDWAGRLIHILAEVADGPVIGDVREFLQGIVVRTAELQHRGVGIGEGGMEDLEAFVSTTLEKWTGAPPQLPRILVYEDAAARGHLRIDRDHFRPALRGLEKLFRILAPVAWVRAEPFVMSRYFEERFGEGRVPLLTFYESYYREHVKPQQEAKAARARKEAEARRQYEKGEETTDGHEGSPGEPEAAEPPPDPDGAERQREPPAGVMALREAHNGLRTLIRQRWAREPEAAEIILTSGDLEEAAKGAPPLPPEPRSFSAFVTWVPRPGDPEGGLVVLPEAKGQSGYGKYFSRFLYLLPEEVLESLRARGETGAETVLAEIAGDAAFNANLRPPIQGCEIVYPTGDRVGCPESLEVSDLEVGQGESGSGLHLYQRGTDRRVFPLDLGFLNPLARPPLYQLLRKFSPASEAYLGIPWGPGPDLPREGVPLHRPRISFEGSVVVAREAWRVPVSEFPAPAREESGADFFLRMVAWRRRLGIPERSYVRAIAAEKPRSEEGGRVQAGDAGKRERRDPRRRGQVGGRDLRKPQYMDFRSPLLIELFHGYRRLGPESALVFEECLPAPEDLPTGPNGHRWVTESILQAEVPVSAQREAPLPIGEELVHV